MSRSQADKALIHEDILKLAAQRFRELGLNGIGVAGLMKEAGRTGGGFYKHFASREKLVEEALAHAFEGRLKALEKFTQDGSQLTLRGLVDGYLSEPHRNDTGFGCVLASIVNDVSRSSDSIRELYTEEVEKELQVLMTLTEAKLPSKKRSQAVLTLCTLIGAVGLARAVADETIEAEILDVRRILLKALNAG